MIPRGRPAIHLVLSDLGVTARARGHAADGLTARGRMRFISLPPPTPEWSPAARFGTNRAPNAGKARLQRSGVSRAPRRQRAVDRIRRTRAPGGGGSARLAYPS